MDPKSVVKQYSNGEVTVVWRASLCQHAGHCVRGLPAVFNPKLHPWIQVEHATTDAIVKTVQTCPSGALTILSHATQPD